jgi:hypothetical protein
MEPSDQGSSRCNAVRVVSLLGKAGLTKLAAHRAEDLIILRQRFHLMFETSVPQSHQTSFFREDAVFENRSSSRSSDNTWICGVSQSELGEYIGLIWSDRVNSAQLWGCSCRRRCFCPFPKTERAAVGAVVSDD